MNDGVSSDHDTGDNSTDHRLLAELAEEFAKRYRRGEQPSIADYARRHPSLATEIRDTFPALIMMEDPGFGFSPDVTPSGERVGTVIGRYKLLEHLGEGGFGIVFMAEQQFPVRRKVALKLIKPGVDTRQVIARFEAERQALALMEHENIARVLDAGATDSGRPYFVMELVRGVPITNYCDQHRLTPRERLGLFIQVCRAVQHAHTKGIIHRDIKPTNVLVTLHDGVPVPKVIDFGVAKAAGQELTEKTLFTNFAQMIGTPLYMSPEQAEMSGLDVDTRSDIYSLGVLLYELLTGTTPVDRDRLRQAAFDEVRRIIREEEPPRPSTRLSTASALPGIAASRGLEGKKLSGLVRGELDWIVMKCLEKDRARRYETVNGLAMDVDRYLKDESVQACPPSKAYQIRKFARRNKAALLITSVGLAGLLTLVVGLAVSNRLITAQRNEKAAALHQKEQALTLATAERDRSRKNFLAASVAIREVITKAALGSDVWAQLTPELRGRMSDEALKFYSSLLQDDSPNPSLRYETGVGYRSIGLLHFAAGNLKRADESYRKSIAILSELSAAAPDELQYRQQLAWSHRMLAGCLAREGQTREAIASFRTSAEIYAGLVTEAPDSFDFRNDLAQCLLSWQRVSDDVPFQQLLDGRAKYLVQRARADLLVRLGRGAEAEHAYRELIVACRKLATDEPDAREYRFIEGTLHFKIGELQSQSGHPGAAEQSYRQSIAVLQRLADESPHDVGSCRELGRSRNWLGLLLRGTGRNQEAEEQHRQATAIYVNLVRRNAPPRPEWNRRELVWSRLNLGSLLSTLQRGAEAEGEFRAAIEICEALRADVPNDPTYSAWSGDLCMRIGLQCASTGRAPEGQKWFAKASTLAGSDSAAHKQLAEIFADKALLPQAEGESREAIRLKPDFAGAHIRLGQVLVRQGKHAEGAAALSEAERLLQHPSPSGPVTPAQQEAGARARWELAEGWLQLDRAADAERLNGNALHIWRQLVKDFPGKPIYRQEAGQGHWRVADAIERAGRKEEAEQHLLAALKLYQELARDNPETRFYRQEVGFSHRKLADLTDRAGRSKEAERHLDDALGCYHRLVEEVPDSAFYRQEEAFIQLQRAKLMRRAERWPEALAAYSEAITLKPDWQNWSARGQLYLERRELEKAAADFAKVIELQPQQSEGWTGRAFCHFHQQQWERAVSDFSKAIDVAPHVHTNWYHRGHCYLALARWELAAADFTKVVDGWPKEPGGYYLRALAHAQSNNGEKALADLRQAVAKGYRDIEQLHKESRLEPIRSRDEFKTLLSSLHQQETQGTRPSSR